MEEVERSKKKQKLEEGKDGKEKSEKVLPNIPFQALLDQYNLGDKVDIRNAVATKTTKFSRFSKYIWVNLQRVVVNAQWQQEKLDHTVFVPDVLDLSSMKGTGKLDSEIELPNDESGAAEAAVQSQTLTLLAK